MALLESLAYWVESCADPTTTLARLSNGGFDVLLKDVRLPDGDAWQSLAELFNRGKLPTRVISMRAFDASQMRRHSAVSGCASHFVNPFGPDELMTVLD